MAIILMGTLLAPLGTCLQQTHRSQHSCCAAPKSSKTSQTNCCTVKTPVPAVVAASGLPDAASVAATPAFISLNEPPSASEVSVAAQIPPQSSPPGAFNLRI
jgi:hypothetical protein